MSKLMTLYMVFEALKEERISLTDKIKVSRQASQKGGSKMFLNEGQKVSIEDILRGIIIHSGNDACIAIAEALKVNAVVKSCNVLENELAPLRELQLPGNRPHTLLRDPQKVAERQGAHDSLHPQVLELLLDHPFVLPRPGRLHRVDREDDIELAALQRERRSSGLVGRGARPRPPATPQCACNLRQRAQADTPPGHREEPAQSHQSHLSSGASANSFGGASAECAAPEERAK